MSSEKPRHRWFRPRYSLATLFVMVTVIGICAGWVAIQMRWIRERREAVMDLDIRIMSTDPGTDNRAPWSLRIFGEKGVQVVWIVGDDYNDAVIKRRDLACRLYPEAKVVLVPRWWAAIPMD